MLEGKELYDGKFLKILWDNPSRIIGINWKESTAEMSDEDFKADFDDFCRLRRTTKRAWNSRRCRAFSA